MTGEHVLFATEGRNHRDYASLSAPLPGHQAGDAEQRAAALAICARAKSKTDAVLLLSICGLPCGETS